MKNILKNKTFLITGGTGSFGSQMVKYLIKSDIRKLLYLVEMKKQEV